MHHSYEGLDRAGGFARGRLFAPLADRGYRRLVGALTVSLLGNGLFIIALTWQVYALSNVPTAMATVGIAMTVPTILCLLVGGAASDRFDRRRVMLIADFARAAAVGLIALLSLSGLLHLWQVFVIGALHGIATAFFDPSSDALVPEIVPESLLAQANSLDQLVRPLALRLVGPAAGGAVVAAVGIGSGFALDAVLFLASGLMLLGLTRDRPAPAVVTPVSSVFREVAAGMGYVRRQPWLWATFASAAVAYLLFMGPTEVLLPYMVKNDLHAGAGGLGLVFAAGGFGSLACAVEIGHRGLPRRAITFMYLTWALATLAVAGYGIAHDIVGLMIASIAFNTLETAGTIAWATAKQRFVPIELLGRVSSLDWLISIGLMPISFALVGPVSAGFGVRRTLIAAGMLGAIVTLAALFVPGVRDFDDRVAESDGGARGVSFEPLPPGELPPLPLAART